MLGEQRPRSPVAERMEHRPGQQGRFISLFICLFSCRWQGHLPGPQQSPLLSCFSAVAVCLTNGFSGLLGWVLVPVSSCPFTSGPSLGLLGGAALGVGGG